MTTEYREIKTSIRRLTMSKQTTLFEYAELVEQKEVRKLSYEQIEDIYKQLLKEINLERTLNYGSGRDVTCEELLIRLERELK